MNIKYFFEDNWIFIKYLFYGFGVWIKELFLYIVKGEWLKRILKLFQEVKVGKPSLIFYLLIILTFYHIIFQKPSVTSIKVILLLFIAFIIAKEKKTGDYKAWHRTRYKKGLLKRAEEFELEKLKKYKEKIEQRSDIYEGQKEEGKGDD